MAIIAALAIVALVLGGGVAVVVFGWVSGREYKKDAMARFHEYERQEQAMTADILRRTGMALVEHDRRVRETDFKMSR